MARLRIEKLGGQGAPEQQQQTDAQPGTLSAFSFLGGPQEGQKADDESVSKGETIEERNDKEDKEAVADPQESHDGDGDALASANGT
jgi:hypothetical protein